MFIEQSTIMLLFTKHNTLSKPKYLATEVGIRIAHSRTSVKTMVNAWKLAPDKYTVRRLDNN